MRAAFIAIAVFTAATLRAADDDASVYLAKIKPVLAKRCYSCHGALKQKSELRLDTAASIRRGAKSGAIINAGAPEKSEMLARVSSHDADERMPPEGEALSAEQIAALAAWIKAGAPGPATEPPESDPRDHWAFKAPVRPAPPAEVRSSRPANAIDEILAAERERHGLMPQPQADAATFARRVYFALTGLPPTREQLVAAMRDPDTVIDTLLASPEHAEHWARHWMDVWRYSDWWGLDAQLRNSQKHIWRWRDWIVESIAADKGYDAMIREMLAGDEIAPNDPQVLRATGFLARNYFLFNRTTWMDETIEHTGKAFLGLTLNCAKCHDHKFDPLTHADYHRFRAIFEPHQVRLDPIPGETDFDKDGLARVFDAHPDEPTYLHPRGDDRVPDKSKVFAPGVPALFTFANYEPKPVALPAEAYAPQVRAYVEQDFLAKAEREVASAREALEQAGAVATQVVATLETGKSPNAMEPIAKDDFAAPHPELWKSGEGEWSYENGRLVQRQTGDHRAVLACAKPVPADFTARVKFTIKGGEQWRSVGIVFDADGGREENVYLSAAKSGPKLQVSWKDGSGYHFPNEAAKAREVLPDRAYELAMAVRGRLVNVSIDGDFVLAWMLPRERQPGRVEVITYDCAAEFHAAEIAALAPAAKLVDAGGAKPLTGAEAKANTVLAEKTLTIAELRLVATRGAFDAERARAEGSPQLSELSRAAALAEKRVKLATAEAGLLRAEQMEAGTRAKDPKAATVADARAAVEKARGALAEPGEAYTPPRASLKGLESPVETEEGRYAPYPHTSTGRRTALAEWITDRRNPLTARVAVNHIWLRCFGEPLVPTVFDFGRRSPAPPQQALLDWLAVELMDHGWSMRHIERLIVTSEAFRMSSSNAGAPKKNRMVDPDNKFLWHMNAVRMESQVVRDSVLALAGALDLTRGGPSIDAAQADSSPRRSVYFARSANDHVKFLGVFDDAEISECYRRQESIVPQQALALSNSRLVLEMARKLATRLQLEAGECSDMQFIDLAWTTILATSPTAAERVECERALAELRATLEAKQQPDSGQRARADLVHALLNHNDFITIR